jgi:hypothetical protein
VEDLRWKSCRGGHRGGEQEPVLRPVPKGKLDPRPKPVRGKGGSFTVPDTEEAVEEAPAPSQTSPQALKAFSAYSALSNPWAQNSSNRPSSRRTSKATCSGCPKRCSITPNFPRSSALLSVSKTLTLVPMRASCGCKELPRIS